MATKCLEFAKADSQEKPGLLKAVDVYGDGHRRLHHLPAVEDLIRKLERRETRMLTVTEDSS